jgi:group I intron endonuclease
VRYGVVYRIRCLVNGKCYHGQTVNPAERWPHHLRSDSHCHALRSAIAKHGAQNFVFEVLAEAFSKEELDALETKWVATSLSPVGYNLKSGGAHGRPSDETRRKLSVSAKEAQNRPEVLAKNSAGVKRAMARPDVKAKHRAALVRALNQPGEKERRRNKMLEVHARPGETAKRSVAVQASWAGYSVEERTQRILCQKAGYTDAVRQKLSTRAAIVMAKPEVKVRHRAGILASMTPERLAAQSAQMKEVHARPGEKAKRGSAISKAHNTPEGKKKLVRRRRAYETTEAWVARVEQMDLEDT